MPSGVSKSTRTDRLLRPANAQTYERSPCISPTNRSGSPSGRFHLHDVGPEVAQHRRQQGRREEGGEIQHPHARQRGRGSRGRGAAVGGAAAVGAAASLTGMPGRARSHAENIQSGARWFARGPAAAARSPRSGPQRNSNSNGLEDSERWSCGTARRQGSDRHRARGTASAGATRWSWPSRAPRSWSTTSAAACTGEGSGRGRRRHRQAGRGARRRGGVELRRRLRPRAVR